MCRFTSCVVGGPTPSTWGFVGSGSLLGPTTSDTRVGGTCWSGSLTSRGPGVERGPRPSGTPSPVSCPRPGCFSGVGCGPSVAVLGGPPRGPSGVVTRRRYSVGPRGPRTPGPRGRRDAEWSSNETSCSPYSRTPRSSRGRKASHSDPSSGVQTIIATRRTSRSVRCLTHSDDVPVSATTTTDVCRPHYGVPGR